MAWLAWRGLLADDLDTRTQAVFASPDWGGHALDPEAAEANLPKTPDGGSEPKVVAEAFSGMDPQVMETISRIRVLEAMPEHTVSFGLSKASFVSFWLLVLAV